MRRNADEDLRKLERAALAGNEEAAERLYKERTRRGLYQEVEIPSRWISLLGPHAEVSDDADEIEVKDEHATPGWPPMTAYLVANGPAESTYVRVGDLDYEGVLHAPDIVDGALKDIAAWDGATRTVRLRVVPDPLRRNSVDENRRREQRRAGSTGDNEDRLKAAISAERSDGEAARIDRLVRYATWRVGEVMRPNAPGAWDRDALQITPQAIANMILEAGRTDSRVDDCVLERFRQRRWCVEERHEEPCFYDGCADCEENCAPPEEGGGSPRYNHKIAAAFVIPHDDEMALGIKAVVTPGFQDGMTPTFRLAFGDAFRVWPAWSNLAATTPSLKTYEEHAVDTDDVRVWDNGGRTADRFTVLMQGETDDEPFYLTISSSQHPSHPQGIWIVDTEAVIDIDGDNALGLELTPWQELLPQGVLNAIWATRGSQIVRLPRALAERWARLTLANYWS